MRAVGVADDLPVVRCRDVKGEGRLDVGLLEAGVHATGIGGLELRIQIHLIIDGVDEEMQALTGAHIGASGSHDEHVGRLQPRQLDAGTIEHLGGVEVTAVEVDRRHLGCDQVDPAI